MERRLREAVRYLGYGKNTADERTCGIIREAYRQLEETAEPKSICRVFGMEQKAEGRVKAGPLEITSRNLGKNLRGCVKLVVFGATLGIGVDRLIKRTSVVDMSRAVILQACAAVLLEEYCDRVQAEAGNELEKEGLFLRPRFSPGYGDFDIRYQEPIMQVLDCAKTIGLTLTEGYMMTPSKSVTAVIGAGPFRKNCPTAGCEACGKTDCAYRR